MPKNIKIIQDYKDCMLLQNNITGIYIVREKFDNDIIFMSEEKQKAVEYAEKYSFAYVVTERRNSFYAWIKEHAQA